MPREYVHDCFRPLRKNAARKKKITEEQRELLEAGVQAAVAAAGNPFRLAIALGLTPAAIYRWTKKGKVPVERINAVAEVTGLSRRKLRPDLY